MIIIIVGSSLQVPFLENNITLLKKCLEIYNTLLSLSDTKGIIEKCPFLKSEEFYNKIIKNLSLVFDKDDIEDRNAYESLCKDVIQIYNSIALKKNKDLTENVWTTLLKVMIGITDYYINKNEQPFFVKDLIHYTFFIFIQSECQSTIFDKYLEKWKASEKAMKCWRDICVAFTKRLHYIINGIPPKFANTITDKVKELYED